MKLNYIFVAALLSFCSCTYHEFKRETDVFIGGYKATTVNGQNVRWGKIWKNGDTTEIKDGNFKITIHSIAVNGNDVYAAGYERMGTSDVIPKYWKNGVGVELKDCIGCGANYISVSGGDVYVSGSHYTDNRAVLWKNNAQVPLQDASTNSFISGMAVSGSDVYLVGWTDKQKYAYWKNGVAHYPNPKAELTSIAVSGNDVYVAGLIRGFGGSLVGPYSYDSIGYWKNGSFIIMGLGESAQVTSIAVESGKVHLLGAQSNGAYSGGYSGGSPFPVWPDHTVYWKDGKATYIEEITNPIAIAVDQNDVHLIGYGSQGFVYWKNGVSSTIGSRGDNVTSLALKSRWVE